MGSALCSVFKQKPVKVLFVGLDAVGKTTLLYKLKLGEIVTTIPTIGFNVEEVDVNGMRTIMWDVGLRDKARPLVRHYLDTMDAVVFMIDSSDRERLDESLDEFFVYMYDGVQERQLPVLVLANKQDRGDRVLSPEEIKRALCKRGGKAFRVNADLEVFPSVALTLEGVSPALDWLTSRLAQRMARRTCLAFSASQWPKSVVQYPASFVKSAYRRVVGLAWSAEEDHHRTGGESLVEGEEG